MTTYSQVRTSSSSNPLPQSCPPASSSNTTSHNRTITPYSQSIENTAATSRNSTAAYASTSVSSSDRAVPTATASYYHFTFPSKSQPTTTTRMYPSSANRTHPVLPTPPGADPNYDVNRVNVLVGGLDLMMSGFQDFPSRPVRTTSNNNDGSTGGVVVPTSGASESGSSASMSGSGGVREGGMTFGTITGPRPVHMTPPLRIVQSMNGGGGGGSSGRASGRR